MIYAELMALSLIFSFAVSSLIFGSPSGFLSGFGGGGNSTFVTPILSRLDARIGVSICLLPASYVCWFRIQGTPR